MLQARLECAEEIRPIIPIRFAEAESGLCGMALGGAVMGARTECDGIRPVPNELARCLKRSAPDLLSVHPSHFEIGKEEQGHDQYF